MTTTAEHIAAIRKALEAGPTPGEWRHGNANGYIANTVFDRKDDGICEVFGIPLHQDVETVLADERHREGIANAMLITSCNPVAMTAVLAEIDRLKAENERMLEALKKLLDRDERNTCQHENTKRGGFIWTICEDCGAQWADDRGGKPQWKDPDEWAIARAAIKGDTHGN